LAAARAASTAAAGAPAEGAARYNSPDNLYETSRLPAGAGAEKRAFTYFVLGGARFLYASAARLAVINAVATLSASADVLALAAVEVRRAAGDAGWHRRRRIPGGLSEPGTTARPGVWSWLTTLFLRALRMLALQVDLSGISPGQTVTVKWRGELRGSCAAAAFKGSDLACP
jgi:hypothetical protein